MPLLPSQINMLLNFHLGENCPCPEEIREELYDFHEDLLVHCGERLRVEQEPQLPLLECQGGVEKLLLCLALWYQSFKRHVSEKVQEVSLAEEETENRLPRKIFVRIHRGSGEVSGVEGGMTSANSLSMVMTACSSNQVKTLIPFLFSYHDTFKVGISVFSKGFKAIAPYFDAYLLIFKWVVAFMILLYR